VVLILARRHYGSHVNTLITNQSAMDLCACIFLTIACAMSFPGAKQNYLELGEVGNNVVCFLFRNRVLSIVCMNAEKIGQVKMSCRTAMFCDRIRASYEKHYFLPSSYLIVRICKIVCMLYIITSPWYDL